MKTKKHTRFCGIDVGKHKHVACVIDTEGKIIAKSQSFLNTAEGFRQLEQRLARYRPRHTLLIAMEATGHYWYALHDYLTRRGYTVVALNPVQTAQQAKKGIRKRKTDRIDARHIATLIKNGDYRPALVPGEFAMAARQLTRLWYALGKQRVRTKQLIRSRLEPVWPEFETYFTNMFSPTARRLLSAAPTPADLLNIDPQALTELIQNASRRRLGADLAKRIRDTAQQSIGMQRGLDGAAGCIRALLSQLEVVAPIRQQLEVQITDLATQLPAYVLTLPGANAVRAMSLFGETDPVRTFRCADELVAFAGLDLTVYQTGQYNAPRRQISKRGSPYLRRTLWTMAQLAVFREGELRTYYLRKRRAGLHHLAATTAAALKLCRISWRILTDQRDYIPVGPPGHH